VTLSSAGVPINGSSTPVIIYTGTTDYKVIIKDSGGSTIYTYDNIDGALDTSSFGGSTSNFQTPVETQATDHTVTTADIGDLYQIDPSGGNRTFTLDSAVDFTDGRRIGVRHNGTANNVLIATVSSEQINLPGGTTTAGYVLTGLGHTAWFVSNGTSWVLDLETPPFITSNIPVFTVTDRVTAPPGSPAAESTYLIIATATGDFAGRENQIAKSDGQGGWIFATPPNDCGWRAYVQDEDVNYQFQDSAWVANEGYVTSTGVSYQLISNIDANIDSAISFTDLSSDYSSYDILISGMAPSDDAQRLVGRLSTNNGSSYANGVTDYSWNFDGLNSGTATDSGDNEDGEIEFTGDIGNDTDETVALRITIHNPMGTDRTRLTWEFTGSTGAGTDTIRTGTGGAEYNTAGATDAIQLFFSAGTMTGNAKLYGRRAT
jgi:hypothetical protein